MVSHRVALICIVIAMAACGSSSPPPTAPTPAPPLTVYNPGNGVSPPALIHEVRPSYTSAAITARVQGSVLMSVVVLADGTVGDVTVTQSLDKVYGLDDQAVLAMKQWLFAPGMKDGVAVAVRITVQMSFSLM